ncbi:MAG: hypothetical protein A2X08_10580 [Bacteroidetes bacterium GWA2_32_17]|nr:MAG: hypothetical protein A2X08_10580 [Bacteroidetes bacterium GWA2_32_17]
MDEQPNEGISYSQRIYRNIPKLIKQQLLVEQYAYKIAVEKFKEPFYFVLYDVTTLYFETFQSDKLRIPGFSKDIMESPLAKWAKKWKLLPH